MMGANAKSANVAGSPSGILVVDKAPGPSSFDIVQKVRKLFGTRRVGHGGTLDPFASGVLPVCLGEGTKLAPYLLDADKVYEATLHLGVETDTYDHTGKVVATSAEGPVSAAVLEDTLVHFRGVISQLPPAYAAIKVQGRPLYDYARKGEEAPRVPRQVTVHELAVTDYSWPHVHLFVRCSKGTYIRSLAHDIGRVLGRGGHLGALRRIRSGPFDLSSAVPSAALSGGATPPLLDVARALGHWPTRVLSDEGCLAITQGKRVAADLSSLAPGTLLRLLREDGSLLAVARAEVAPEADPGAAPSRLKPERVFLENARNDETKALNPSRFV